MRLILSLPLILLLSCNGIKDTFDKSTPYEKYQKLLKKTDLDETAMGKQWLEAGAQAFRDSLIISLPHRESGYFRAGEPEAHSYRFDIMAGQKLEIQIQVSKREDSRLFLDLFQWKKNEWDHLTYGDSTNIISVEFKNATSCLLRIQPELLITAAYIIDFKISPQFNNPVMGASNRSIKSYFGAPRDAGRRKHEGIDIFASRGTPVVSPVRGLVTRVGSSGLGGKVVWVRDSKRGILLYFAHLDQQLVNAGEHVRPGDTLGVVGNTGNARFTAHHLHFGIYRSGAIDPWGYVKEIDNSLPEIRADTSILGKEFRVSVRTVNLRQGPATRHPVIEELRKGTYLYVIGETAKWYRVQLPDETEGYVFQVLTEKILSGSTKKIMDNIAVLTQPSNKSIPIANVFAPAEVEVLAHYENFQFIRTENGVSGWINAPSVR